MKYTMFNIMYFFTTGDRGSAFVRVLLGFVQIACSSVVFERYVYMFVFSAVLGISKTPNKSRKQRKTIPNKAKTILRQHFPWIQPT